MTAILTVLKNNDELMDDVLFHMAQYSFGQILIEELFDLAKLIDESKISFGFSPSKHKPQGNVGEESINGGRAGTGFFLNNYDIVTNAHVVEGCKYIFTSGVPGTDTATVVAVDKLKDLAIIRVKNKSEVYALLQESHFLEIGNQIIVVGYPDTKYAFSRFPIKNKFRRINTIWHTSHNVVVIDEADTREKIGSGSSGSPALDRQGNVVGIIHSGNREEQEGYMLFPIDLRNFIEVSKIPYTKKTLIKALTDEELERYGASFTVRIYCAY